MGPMLFVFKLNQSSKLQGIVKPVLSDHSKKGPKLVFNTDYPLMQDKSIAECSKGSTLQYLRSSLSYHLSLRSLFCLFLSGRLRQVLLYHDNFKIISIIILRGNRLKLS